MKKTWLALILIFALAAGLRLVKLLSILYLLIGMRRLLHITPILYGRQEKTNTGKFCHYSLSRWEIIKIRCMCIYWCR